MDRKLPRFRVILGMLLAVSVTVVTLDSRRYPGGPLRRARHGAVSTAGSIQDGFARALDPAGRLTGALDRRASLRAESARLADRVRELEAEQRRFPEVLRERQRLLALVGAKDWTAGARVGARVIGVDPSNHEWSVLIDKGEADGLRDGMAVVSSEGLVGRVVLAAAAYSKVLAIIDPRHSVGARLTATGETGAIRGAGVRDLRFDLIDAETAVEVGESVVTSGHDRGLYPPGIPIGRVTQVRAGRDGLSKIARVVSFVDFSRLDLVEVLTESGALPRGSSR
ncbi:MAG: rod shape-determining protein MreC [Actinomycetota bacterium]